MLPHPLAAQSKCAWDICSSDSFLVVNSSHVANSLVVLSVQFHSKYTYVSLI